MLSRKELKDFLEEKYLEFNVPGFIQDDPVCIPHRFSKQHDIEISGFFAATLAWGQRKTIINSCDRLLALMDNAPYDFVLNHDDSDLKALEKFVHRTFQATDLYYFIFFLRYFYTRNESLEDAFLIGKSMDMKGRLIEFHNLFFSLSEAPERTKKHIATPLRKSTCKRLNMFLRWMVRSDDRGVDFGIWKNIPTKDLICPFDIHVGRISRQLGLVKRRQNDWMASMELTENLRRLDPVDPCKYDFALFGLGIEEKLKGIFY